MLCATSFVLIYFSSIAISFWTVILNYAWYISFKTLGTKKSAVRTQVTYFHLISWGFASLLTVIILLLRQVRKTLETTILF